MYYFLMQRKFLWIESIFDRMYSVLHFFDSSNFVSLCKIYKILLCFYQEIFLFSIALDSLDCTGFRSVTSDPEPGTHDARLENQDVPSARMHRTLF